MSQNLCDPLQNGLRPRGKEVFSRNNDLENTLKTYKFGTFIPNTNSNKYNLIFNVKTAKLDSRTLVKPVKITFWRCEILPLLETYFLVPLQVVCISLLLCIPSSLFLNLYNQGIINLQIFKTDITYTCPQSSYPNLLATTPFLSLFALWSLKLHISISTFFHLIHNLVILFSQIMFQSVILVIFCLETQTSKSSVI